MNELITYILKKIRNGTTKKGAPFKFGSLASSYKKKPEQRMVVIREITNNELIIYTDNRSQKIEHFKKNNKASLLFYDSETMEQLILKGVIKIENTDTNKVWKTIPKFAHRDYTSVLAPGTSITSEIAEYSETKHNFCYLKFTFDSIDYLNIDKPCNKRVQFSLDQNNSWKGTYVVP